MHETPKNEQPPVSETEIHADDPVNDDQVQGLAGGSCPGWIDANGVAQPLVR